MPAKHIQRVDAEGVYSHIYNRGVARRNIFNDDQDYGMFIDYLRDYLMPPSQFVTGKKTFTVRGQTFQGLPHQSKNYYNQVELIAYDLRPNHFHLLLHQKTHGAVEKFIRSLCTRYAIYFNKKYQCVGSLFEGPYKSIQIKKSSDLLYLTHYFYSSAQKNSQDLPKTYTSYPEYICKKETLWVKPKVVLSFFALSENTFFRGNGGFKNFIEKYTLNQNELDELERIILENASEHLEKRSPALERKIPDQPRGNQSTKPDLRIPEVTVAMTIFCLLFVLGYRNILAATVKLISPIPQSIPQVAGIDEVKSIKMVLAKINGGSETVTIYQNPFSGSEKVAEAKTGDSFELITVNPEWYQVKLNDGRLGYISARYIEIIEETN